MSAFYTNSIHTLDAIPLQQLKKEAALLNRVDTKYAFPIDQLSAVLEKCRSHYHIVTVNNNRLCRYETTYFDSPDLTCYHMHHAGHANRVKIRLRRYVETDNCFLEVKHRTNKGRTNKPRLQLQPGEASPLYQLHHAVFSNISLPCPEALCESVQVDYTRITLSSKTSAERVTLDLRLAFSNRQKKLLLPDLVIAEVKQDKNNSSPFKLLMQQMHLQQGGISKYCFAVLLLNDHVKKNRFKPKLHELKKRTNYHVLTSDRY